MNNPTDLAAPNGDDREYDAAGNCLDFGCEGNNVTLCEHARVQRMLAEPSGSEVNG